MSKSLCAISGVSFATEHMPISLSLTAREVSHPIFSASYSQLSLVASDWVDDKLDKTQSYLLYLALFNITDMIHFRVPVTRSDKTDAIVAANMPALLKIVDVIIHVGTQRCKSNLLLPEFVVTPDNKQFLNSKHWIELWQAAHLNYLDGYKSSNHLQKIADKEARLEALIKDKSKDISSYAVQLANWAYDVAGFASYQSTVFGMTSKDGSPLKIGEYWRQLIVDCAKRTDIYMIHDADLSELIEELEDNISVASSGIFGHTVLALLNSTRKAKAEFFTLGEVDVTSRGTMYKILNAEDSVEDANKIVIIQSAPLTEPKESEYPNKLAYIKARTKWDMACRYAASDAIRAEINNSVVSQVTEVTPEVTPDIPATPDVSATPAITYKGTEL